MASIKTFFKSLIDAIIFSNTWISLAALSLYLSAHSLLEIPINYFGAGAIFTSTFLGYNFLKLKGLKYQSNSSVFFQWIKKHKSYLYFLLIINAIYFFYSFAFLALWQQIAYLIAASISVVYFGINQFNLRKYWLLKIPLVALVWSILIVFTTVPFLIELSTGVLFLFVFVLIAGLTIPFEIRDFNTDRESLGEVTLLYKMGLKKTKQTAFVHLLLAFLVLFYFSLASVFLLPLFLVAIYIIVKLRYNSSEYYYTFLLDGILVFLYPFVYYLI